MYRLSERLIASLMVLFLLSYVVYQAYRYYYNPLQVEAVFSYTVAHSIEADGIAVRDETVIRHAGSGIRSFVFEDGDRVSVGQTVVEFYDSEVSDSNVKRMREIQQEIKMLENAQNPALSNYSNAEALGRDIKERLGDLVQMSSTGRFDGAQDLKGSVTSLLNRRQIATGKEADYQQRIDALQGEYGRLETASTAATLEVATAPLSGYFVKGVDGLEGLLGTGLVGESDIAGYRSMIESARRDREAVGAVGKIVTSQNWYYIALVPKYDIQWVRTGQSVSLQFESVSGAVTGTVEEILQENEEEEAALIISCNFVSGELLSMRADKARISFQHYTGLRINTSSLRFQVNDKGVEEMGVYVLSRNTVRFKRVDPIYEESSFILSRASDSSLDNAVSLYDQVITKGRELYDGKVID